MENENYEFSILHEVVASDDLFPDKTHEKVANTLFNLIQSSDRGVTIGLEGGWGSGKSTVVNFLRNKLVDNNDKTLFFLFDAWAHDGDPLRRIFLESLINKIDPERKDEKLTGLLQEISGRKKTVAVKTKKSTSKLGGWLSAAAILVPVGAAILSAIDYGSLTISLLSFKPHWPLIIGASLALAPLWTLILWFFCGDKGENKWALFASEAKESYTQDITEDSERTSIEFERFFTQIMEHSIDNGGGYEKALIVVDNLDRVEPEQTLAIWSILQTFFQHRSSHCSEKVDSWPSKLWFLVPYDKEGLSQVWDKSDQPVAGNSVDSPLMNADPPTQNQTNKPDDLAHSFLEKCFQIIAEVPEPVMSAWVEYAENAIRKSLYGWPKVKQEEVISTYKRFESRLESSPTPRQIQSFINRVGLLGLRWRDEMSAEAIALYALLRKKRSDRQLRQDLLVEGLPDGYEGETDSHELKMQLAGMLFGVEKGRGIELLLKPEIQSALNTGDSERFRSLIEKYEEAFWIVWQSIRESSLPNGHNDERRIAVTKAFCEGMTNHKDRTSKDIDRLISEWKHGADDWQLDRHDYSEALTALLSMVNSKDKLNKLLTWLEVIVNKAILNSTKLVGEENFKPSELPNISKLITLLEMNGKKFKRAHYPNLDPTKWGLWLDAIDSMDISIDFVLPTQDTIKGLAGGIDITTPDTKNLELLMTSLPYLPKDKGWEDVANSLIKFAKNPNHTLGINATYELMSAMYFSCSETVKEKLKAGISTPQFNTRAESEAVDSVPALLVLCAAAHTSKLQESPTSQNVKAFWQAEFDPVKCQPAIDLLRKYGELSIVWLLAIDASNKVAIGIIRENIDEIIYHSSYGVRYIDEYSWASEKELAKIVSKSAELGGLSKARTPLIEEPVPYRGCLKLIRVHGGKEGIDIVESALKNTSAAQWAETLSEDTLLSDCIDQLGNHEFKEGLQTLLYEELDGGELSDHIWDHFLNIYNKLMDKKDVAKTIATKYFNRENDPLSEQAFEQLFPCIADFISNISPALLMARIEEWLINSQWPRISSLLTADFEFDDPPKESLASRVTTLLNDENEENKEVLLAIAKACNIQIIPEEAEEVVND